MGKVWTVTDANKNGPSYAYVFSVCGNTDLKQSTLTPELQDMCLETNGIAGEVLSNPVPAYQVVDGRFCKRVGEDQDGTPKERYQRGHQMEWSLLDPLNPAMGLELFYPGGNTCKQAEYQDSEYCDHPGGDGHMYCERGLRIRLTCNPSEEDFPLENSITESSSCVYELRANSKFACPVECPRGPNGKVCSGRGVCMFNGYGADDDALEEITGADAKGTATASCACNMGYFGQMHYGPDCSVYSRWGTTYSDNYNYLAQRPEFWRKLWLFLFLLITSVTLVVHRQRVIPVYTGVLSLLRGDGYRPQDPNAVTYQRVATNKPTVRPMAAGKIGTKYTIDDLEEEDDVGSTTAAL